MNNFLPDNTERVKMRVSLDACDARGHHLPLFNIS